MVMCESPGLQTERKNSFIHTDAHLKFLLENPRALAEKSAAIIDLRVPYHLGTKVLADKVTIDEFAPGCSNPKVDSLGTEVYG
jgi:hypothetical protein